MKIWSSFGSRTLKTRFCSPLAPLRLPNGIREACKRRVRFCIEMVIFGWRILAPSSDNTLSSTYFQMHPQTYLHSRMWATKGELPRCCSSLPAKLGVDLKIRRKNKWKSKKEKRKKKKGGSKTGARKKGKGVTRMKILSACRWRRALFFHYSDITLFFNISIFYNFLLSVSFSLR